MTLVARNQTVKKALKEMEAARYLPADEAK